ncbi:hypothetical protein KCU94_g21065, partial [Aureobasidium melanogenum]
QWLSNQQPTSAVKSAELTWQLGHCSFPPLRLLLGSFAVESIRDRLRCIIEEIEDWKHLSFPRAEDSRDQQTPQPAGDDSTSQQQLTPGDEIAEVADGDMEIDEG